MIKAISCFSVGTLFVCVGCGAGPDSAEGSLSREVSEPIINGTVVTSQNLNPGVVEITQPASGCSGTIIRKNWVLTARHCVTTDQTVNGPVQAPGTFSVTNSITGVATPIAGSVGVTKVVADSGQDVALLRLASPLVSNYIPIFDADVPYLRNAPATVYGYGVNTVSLQGYGTLRMAQLDVSSVGTTTFNIGANSSGQITFHGDSGGPALMQDLFGRRTVAGVCNTGDGVTTATDAMVSNVRRWIKRSQFVPGDVNGDGYPDIALSGGAWGSLPVAWGLGDGNFIPENVVLDGFPTWANTPTAKIITGDFNGDGLSDVALTGGPWQSVPLALSNGDFSYHTSNQGGPGTVAATFAAWASSANVQAVPGDFNGDGVDDILLTGNPNWGSMPVGSPQPDGSISTSNVPLADFPRWAASANVTAVPGDFDGDGLDDIALTGNPAWGSVPVAFSTVGGVFTVKNVALATFPALAAAAGAVPVSGDFDGDGRDDIALVGGSSTNIAIARSVGQGQFTVTNLPIASFAAWAQRPGVSAVVGDYNRDGFDDIALVGGNFTTIPVAFSQGNGTFAVSNQHVPDFNGWAAQPHVVALGGHKKG